MPLKCEEVTVPFGKHKGETLSSILQDDARYLDWLNSAELYGDLKRAVKEMCVKYAAEIERAIGN